MSKLTDRNKAKLSEATMDTLSSAPPFPRKLSMQLAQND